ncbi:G-patch-domain-containing protein, partial [Martensiomyces pterosporus]
LQPMNTYERRIVHILAKEYGINSKSHGNGSNRSTILTPTPSTCKPRNTKRIDKLLLLFDEGGLIPQQWCGGPTPKEGRGAGAGKKAGRAGKAGKAGKSGSSSSQSGKKMVAEDAPAVGASNIGHQMLTQMGWAPGQGLGANQEGRSTPVDVMIRSGRQGLGA